MTNLFNNKPELMRLLREKAPKIIPGYVSIRVHKLNEKLRNLRQEYKNEKDEKKKVEIEKRANEIKKELLVYNQNI